MSSFAQIDEEINEDFLEVDPKIPGQNFVCLSFVSPDKVLKQKEIHFTTKFLEHVFNGEDQYTIDMREKMINKEIQIDYDTIKNYYEDWKYSRNDKLEAEFYEKNNYRTTMRGLKIRGTYDTHKEATIRAQVLRRKDPNFNVFVGQVGSWLPWDPECEQVPEQEYQEQMLNDLVKKYKENLENRDEFFDQTKEEQIKRAREELKLKKEKLAEEQEQIKESTDDNKKKIEELREIVDESDKQYYENMKKMKEQKESVNPVVTDVTDSSSVADVSSITDVPGSTVVSDTPQVTEETSTTNELNISDEQNFQSETIKSMETEDPWLKSKKSEE